MPLTRRGAGRPTREQAEARFEELLDTALDLFLERGYELATIDLIAERMNMTKRTVYAKFPDKAALFMASVQRAIEQQLVPAAELHALDQGDLRETLRAIGMQRLGLIQTRNGLRLQRIIATESYRFPHLLMLNYNQSAKPVVDFIEGLFQREVDEGRLQGIDPALAASVFMSMVVSGPSRKIVAGEPMEPNEVEEAVAFAVNVFLDGIRPR